MTTLLGRKEKKTMLPIDLGNELTLDLWDVTPDMATNLLKASIGNRQIALGHVTRISKDMILGRYNDYLYDPIRITYDGLLADGHHRLTAIIKTGTTHRMLVISGYAHEDFMSMDQNAKRNIKHTFQVLGLSYATERASTVTVIERLMASSTPMKAKDNRTKPSNPDAVIINNYLDSQYPRAFEDVIRFIKTQVVPELGLPQGIATTLMLLQHEINPELCEDFWEGFVLGKDNALVNQGDPRYALRSKLKSEKQRLDRAKLIYGSRPRDNGWNEITIVTWIHYAFMKFVKGGSLRRLVMSDELRNKIWGEVYSFARIRWLPGLEENGYVRIRDKE